MELIDTHCHLDFPIFDQDRPEILHRAAQAQVSDIIVPAISAKYWQRLLTLSAQTAQSPTKTRSLPKLHLAYGLHPMFLADHQWQDIERLQDIVSNYHTDQQKIVAIGECGLDFFVAHLDRQQQIAFFEAQVKLALETDLPLIIHARKSLDIVLKILRQHSRQATSAQGLRGVIHSFSGSAQQAEQCIALGFMLGFGGVVTYPRAKKLRRLVNQLPLSSIVLETDAPDQVDAMSHEKRNEPARLLAIAKTIAELRQIELATLAQTTSNNARWLFSLS
ncbi:MAG: TatD family hydrolase [bacterium]